MEELTGRFYQENLGDREKLVEPFVYLTVADAKGYTANIKNECINRSKSFRTNSFSLEGEVWDEEVLECKKFWNE